MPAEHLAHAPRFHRVVQHGRGAVIVDVADLLGPPPGALDRQGHRADNLLARRRHLDAVIRIAGRRVAVDRGVDRGAPGARAVLALEHEHPRALAEDEAVAPPVERPRRFRRPVVVGHRQRLHAREAEDHPRRDACVGAARQHHVGLARAQQRGGVADRVGRARAAARQHVADAAQPQRDRDLARQHPDNGDRDGVRGHLLAALEEEVVIVPLADVDPAAAAADHDAGVRLGDRQPRVGPRLARGDHADQRGARVALRIGAVVVVPDVVAAHRRHVVQRDAGDRRRHLAGELRRVELGDRARGAAAAADVIPEALAADAERRHHADSRDDDAR